MFDAPATASSKATDRDVTNINVLSELLKLAKNGPFLFLIFAAGATQGIFTSWSGMLGLILAELPETAQSFLGFGSNIAGGKTIKKWQSVSLIFFFFFFFCLKKLLVVWCLVQFLCFCSESTS